MVRPYLAIPDAFTNAECDAILALAEAADGAPAPVWDGIGYAVDTRQRDATTVALGRDPSNGWLFERLDALFAAAAGHFALRVGPVGEPIQIVRYAVGQHFRAWHSDAGRDRHVRRQLSMSVELSALAAHDGGDLEVVPERVGLARDLDRGGAQLFPSRALHRVTPVRRGLRWALVAWTG